MNMTPDISRLVPNLHEKFGQVLAHARYGRAADLWSFGCVVIATWQETGELGWKNTSGSQRKASLFVFVGFNFTLCWLCNRQNKALSTKLISAPFFFLIWFAQEMGTANVPWGRFE